MYTQPDKRRIKIEVSFPEVGVLHMHGKKEGDTLATAPRNVFVFEPTGAALYKGKGSEADEWRKFAHEQIAVMSNALGVPIYIEA